MAWDAALKMTDVRLELITREVVALQSMSSAVSKINDFIVYHDIVITLFNELPIGYNKDRLIV